MRVLDIFSGIGGFSLGLESTGCFETIGFCEIESFPREVLRKHWPGVPIHDDIRTLSAESVPWLRAEADRGGPDLICGGFPCDDISNAGRRRGLRGPKSGLWREFRRLLVELQPRWCIVENSSHGWRHWGEAVVGEFRNAGYETVAFNIAASDLGAPHQRRRAWVLANSGRGRCRVASEALRARRPESVFHAGWATEPGIRRVDDGVPHRVDRLRALGEAVVPQVVAVIGKAIAEADS